MQNMKKWCVGAFSFLLLLVAGVLTARNYRPIEFKFQQNDYKLEFQRAELVRRNNQLVKQFDMRTFKYNRTCAVFNITKIYNIDLDNDLEVVLQAYKFMSNEYRYFPIRVQFNFCSGVSQNLFGMHGFTACGNLTGCPLKKGRRYHICNFAPDPSQFPPLIPDGEYMLEFQGLYHTTELFVQRAYGKISRPIVMP